VLTLYAALLSTDHARAIGQVSRRNYVATHGVVIGHKTVTKGTKATAGASINVTHVAFTHDGSWMITVSLGRRVADGPRSPPGRRAWGGRLRPLFLGWMCVCVRLRVYFVRWSPPRPCSPSSFGGPRQRSQCTH
jgi:hypothetical protein